MLGEVAAQRIRPCVSQFADLARRFRMVRKPRGGTARPPSERRGGPSAYPPLAGERERFCAPKVAPEGAWGQGRPGLPGKEVQMKKLWWRSLAWLYALVVLLAVITLSGCHC